MGIGLERVRRGWFRWLLMVPVGALLTRLVEALLLKWWRFPFWRHYLNGEELKQNAWLLCNMVYVVGCWEVKPGSILSAVTHWLNGAALDLYRN